MSDLNDTMVFFDWNGTIVRDTERARGALNVVLEHHGRPLVSTEDFPRDFVLPLAEMFRLRGIGASAIEEATSTWNRLMAGTAPDLREGVDALLADLRSAGALTGVVTAADQSSIDFDIESTGLRPTWDLMFSAAADKVAALSSIRPNRRRAIYIGDTEYDMRSAITAGFEAVGIDGGYARGEALLAAGASYVAEDVEMLRRELFGARAAAGFRD